jgi:hypothetical protein
MKILFASSVISGEHYTAYSVHLSHNKTGSVTGTEIGIIIIIALQPFVGSWPLFQFLVPIHSR